MDVKEFIFNSPTNGGKSKIILNKDSLTISRPGILSKFSHGFCGEKTILIKNISAVQVKNAGFGRGYIQFILMGSQERKSGLIKGSKDENIVYFDSDFHKKEYNENAKYIKEYIEQYNSQSTNNKNPEDKYSQLEKLKNLFDKNIITEEEFIKEKQKILNS